MTDIQNVVEIGGGMGYLMRDFLTLRPDWRAKMIDISPCLLEQQKKTLATFNVDFELADVLTLKPAALSSYDLAILNENIGDFPTLVDSPEDRVPDNELGFFLERLRYFRRTYNVPANDDQSVNIGAMDVVEKLCLAGIKYIYISEHSCEASVPEAMKPYLHIEPANVPEEITLRGHREYTIKFSYLQIIAEMLNYKIKRGPLADFLPLELNDKIKTALRLTTPISDEQEIIRQFVYDLYKYEYLVLMKGEVR